MVSALRVTIDTNCVINLFDSASESATSVEELDTLFRYALDGKVQIAATTRVEADILKDRDEARRRSLLRSLGKIPIISTVGRWNRSAWGKDVWVSDRTARLVDEIQQILFPGLAKNDLRYSNKINDVDHLTGHMIDRRDIFVTDDRGILRRRNQLAQAPGIIVMTPTECLAHVDRIALKLTPKLLAADDIARGYQTRALRGSVTFDYSNNNGRYVIGEACHSFETKWSKASNVGVYAYSDSPSIEALALAKGAAVIRGITDANAYDYSSRHRLAQLGQIVIWKNVNGFYAATKVAEVKDDCRGDDRDELTFEYLILANGKADFMDS